MRRGNGYYWVEDVLIAAAPKGEKDKEDVTNGANWNSIECYLTGRLKPFSLS